MSILKSSNSGRLAYWEQVLQNRGYWLYSYVNHVKIYTPQTKPFEMLKNYFDLEDNGVLTFFIASKDRGLLEKVYIKDIAHIELVEKFWDIENDTDIKFINWRSKLRTQIINYTNEHSEINK